MKRTSGQSGAETLLWDKSIYSTAAALTDKRKRKNKEIGAVGGPMLSMPELTNPKCGTPCPTHTLAGQCLLVT